MKKFLLSVNLLLLIPQIIQAVESEPVVVTATRTAQTIDDTLAPVSVFTRDDIERLQPQSIQDLLKGSPGLSISNNGGLGKVTSFFLRGTESDHILVLIDGIRVGSATLGTTMFQHIPIEQIERIEIVRGPHSSLYGSDAIGGVIQIFTRKGKGNRKLTPSISFMAGSYNTKQLTADISGGTDKVWFNASLGILDSDGFNACNGEPATAGCFTTEPDKDGYERTSASARAGFKLNDKMNLDFNWLRSENETMFDGGFQNESESYQEVLGAKLDMNLTAKWQAILSVGRSTDDIDSYLNGVFSSNFHTDRDSLSFQNDITLADNKLLTVGIDYLDDKIESTTSYPVTSRDNVGVFAQYLAQYGVHSFQLSIRNDDNERSGNHTTGSINWGHEIGNGLKVRASYGTAFKAPTFNELYFPFFGSANAQPEKSKSLEIGITSQQQKSSWAINVFNTKVDDLLAYDSSISAVANIQKTELTGIEAEAATRIAGWSLTGNLTLLDPVNKSAGSNNGNVLPRRAEQSLRIDMDKKFGKYSLGASLNGESHRYDDLANTRRLGSYATIDLRASYKLAKAWLLQGRIENLFDKDYELASYYNQPERSIYLTIGYQPE